MKTLFRILFVAYLSIFLGIFPYRESLAFTVGEEKEVGEKLFYAVRSSFKVLDDPDLTQYISKLGDEVIKVAGVQFFNYHFFIINNKEFNAFAAPSGLIFFHSGLIEKMDSENELISVLAHEIGHVAKRHISARISKGQKISIATMGLILASLALGGGAATEALFAGSIAAGESANLHFSRLDEEEADLLAYDWMKKLNRNPDGQVKMLQTMRQIARYRSGMIPQYLLTHPNPEARLDYVQSIIDSEHEQLTGMKKGDDVEFLRFKYRILTQVKDSIYLRGFFSSVIASERTDDTEKIMAKYGLAQLERSENNYDTSLSLINEIIDKYQDRSVFLVDKGIIEFESGMSKKAYATLEEAYNKNRDDMFAAFSLARVSFSLGEIEKADNLFKDVMYTTPKFSKVYFELGRLSSSQGLSAEPNYYLGKYYLLEGKDELSKKNLEAAISNDALPPELELDAKRSLDLIKKLNN